MKPKMIKAKDADAMLLELAPPIRRLVAALRAFVTKHSRGLDEEIKWGSLCWVANGVVCYVHPHESHVDFGFFKGVDLDDPAEVLGGKGIFLRHVKIHKVNDIREKEFAKLLKQAIELDG